MKVHEQYRLRMEIQKNHQILLVLKDAVYIKFVKPQENELLTLP